MDYPKNPSKAKKIPIKNFFLSKAFSILKAKILTLHKEKLYQKKMRQDVKAKKNPQNSCSSKVNAKKKLFLAK